MSLKQRKKRLMAKGKATSKVEIRLSLGPEYNSLLEIRNVGSKLPRSVHAKYYIIIKHLQHPRVHWETLTCYLHFYTVKALSRRQHLTPWSGNLHLKLLWLTKLTQNSGKLLRNKTVGCTRIYQNSNWIAKKWKNTFDQVAGRLFCLLMVEDENPSLNPLNWLLWWATSTTLSSLLLPWRWS